MKKIILILLIIMTSIFSQEIKKEGAFEIFGGMSIPFDDNSEDTTTGLNLGVSGVKAISNHISFGGSIIFNRWTEEENTPLINLEVSLRYIEALALIRATSTERNGICAFVQVGAGAFLGTMMIDINGESDTETKNDFGISVSGGLVFDRFVIFPSFKRVYTEKGDDVKWLALSLGFSL